MQPNLFIQTGEAAFDELPELIASFLRRSVLDLIIDAERIRGYRAPDARSLWIRDYSDMLRGVRHIEHDVQSVVTHFAATQAGNGRVFDYLTTIPEKLPGERENWTKYVRVPVEADVEFRLVKAAWLAWQACGDDEWIARLLPRLEKALTYTTGHPWRRDTERGLVKRAYTIDTWDFAYTAGRHEWLQFQIDDETYWGIMHGDNTGLYEAMGLLAKLHDHLGSHEAAGQWRDRAAALREQIDRVCWNGRFYTHFVKITPVVIPGVDETAQLSLGNPMAINRGACTHEQAVSILREYQQRRATTSAFAEWFSIDPPFPDGIFGDPLLRRGAYCNGGIMPLVGGELARAAFEHGLESYGADILRRYHRLIAPRGESYLWYFPDGRPSSAETSTSPEASASDGWGSSAMLWALIEGLAGVQDLESCYRRVRLAPRWPAAGLERAEVRVGYPASGCMFGYHWRTGDDGTELWLDAPHTEQVDIHLLIPGGDHPSRVILTAPSGSSHPLEFTVHTTGRSVYADFRLEAPHEASLRIETRKGG